jgi:phosphohistidine phosphatase SixA
LQTAEIAGSLFRYKEEILRTKALLPTSTPEHVWDEIRVHQKDPSLMLVGHDPLFTSLAAYLLGAPDLQIDFKKGAILRIDFESFGPKPRGILRWFVVAKLAGKQHPQSRSTSSR